MKLFHQIALKLVYQHNNCQTFFRVTPRSPITWRGEHLHRPLPPRPLNNDSSIRSLPPPVHISGYANEAASQQHLDSWQFMALFRSLTAAVHSAVQYGTGFLAESSVRFRVRTCFSASRWMPLMTSSQNIMRSSVTILLVDIKLQSSLKLCQFAFYNTISRFPCSPWRSVSRWLWPSEGGRWHVGRARRNQFICFVC